MDIGEAQTELLALKISIEGALEALKEIVTARLRDALNQIDDFKERLDSVTMSLAVVDQKASATGCSGKPSPAENAGTETPPLVADSAVITAAASGGAEVKKSVCPAWCGTTNYPDTTRNVVLFSRSGAGIGYCYVGCRDSGRPLNPSPKPVEVKKHEPVSALPQPLPPAPKVANMSSSAAFRSWTPEKKKAHSERMTRVWAKRRENKEAKLGAPVGSGGTVSGSTWKPQLNANQRKRAERAEAEEAAKPKEKFPVLQQEVVESAKAIIPAAAEPAEEGWKWRSEKLRLQEHIACGGDGCKKCKDEGLRVVLPMS